VLFLYDFAVLGARQRAPLIRGGGAGSATKLETMLGGVGLESGSRNPPVTVCLGGVGKGSKKTRRREPAIPLRALCARAATAQAVAASLEARSAESWGMPALARPMKITFGEMRASGIRDLLIYCSDYRCSRSIQIGGDRWPDDIRLSDIEPLFVCKDGGRRGAEVRDCSRPPGWARADEIHWLGRSAIYCLLLGTYETLPIFR
jgi:hypothetical protein